MQLTFGPRLCFYPILLIHPVLSVKDYLITPWPCSVSPLSAVHDPLSSDLRSDRGSDPPSHGASRAPLALDGTACRGPRSAHTLLGLRSDAAARLSARPPLGLRSRSAHAPRARLRQNRRLPARTISAAVLGAPSLGRRSTRLRRSTLWQNLPLERWMVRASILGRVAVKSRPYTLVSIHYR